MYLIYAYNPAGIGGERQFPPAITNEVLATLREVSRTHSEKSIAVVGLDKCFDRCRTGVRALNEWYMGTPNRIHGLLFRNGVPVDQVTLVEPM